MIRFGSEFVAQRCVDADNGVVELFLFGIRPIGQKDNGQINGARRCECQFQQQRTKASTFYERGFGEAIEIDENRNKCAGDAAN